MVISTSTTCGVPSCFRSKATLSWERWRHGKKQKDALSQYDIQMRPCFCCQVCVSCGINRKNLKNDPLFQKVIHSMVSFSFIFKYFYDFDWLCMYWSHHYWSYPPTARQVWPHGSGRKSPHRWLAVEILWNLGSEQWATRFDDPLGLPKILPIGTNQPRFSNDPLGGIKMLHIHTYSVRFD